ncbi:MAG: PIN domain nuclease [Propionibacteriaceae bacterium]|jgi:predicted nucleic acid-binding protein|nr:PIN domain nuclease [Propionibacteriaceae bacterium]
MAVTKWLIDKSAYARLDKSDEPHLWLERIGRGLVHISNITRLELGFSFQSADQSRMEFSSPPLSLMPVENLTPSIEERALEVQFLLTGRGQHRAPSIPDLLIAASAEKLGLTVLHVDKDFDLIAAITDQSVERLMTAG